MTHLYFSHVRHGSTRKDLVKVNLSPRFQLVVYPVGPAVFATGSPYFTPRSARISAARAPRMVGSELPSLTCSGLGKQHESPGRS